jgi:hypothetical protein
MALVVENGSLVTGANSFVSVAEARAFAAARASNLPESDEAVEAAAVVAADFLETFAARFKGSKVDPEIQALTWPRKDVVLDGWAVPITTIPQALKNAQCQLIIEAANGLDLMPTGTGREIIREKIDVIETQYQPGAGGSPQPFLTKALAFLEPLLSTGAGLRVERF